MGNTQIQGLNEAGVPVSFRSTGGGIMHTIDAHGVWAAKGYGYQAMATAAVAALVVRPSTTAMATLFNNESGGGKAYVIERVFAHNLVTASEEQGGIWLCVHPTGMAAPTNDITVRNNTGGKAAGGSLSIFDNGATVVNDGWFPWGAGEWTNLDGTAPGGQIEVHIDGEIVVPPQAGISLHVVATTTANTYTAGFHWFEVPLAELATA